MKRRYDYFESDSCQFCITSHLIPNYQYDIVFPIAFEDNNSSEYIIGLDISCISVSKLRKLMGN